jgi:hypothetical protein
VPSEGTNSTNDTVRKVLNAYSETVMAVPHYSTEYDDSIYQSMAVEFGAPVVEYMNENNNPSDVILNKIMRESRTALSRRERFIPLLHEEQDSLIQMESRINDVEERILELKNRTDDYNEICPSNLDTLQSRCDTIACDRQSLIHDRLISSLSGVDEESLLKYLYGERDFRYPVLSEIVRCRRKIRKIRNA